MANVENLNTLIHSTKNINKSITDAYKRGYNEIHIFYNGPAIESEEITFNCPEVEFVVHTISATQADLTFTDCVAKTIEFRAHKPSINITFNRPKVGTLSFKDLHNSINELHIVGDTNSSINTLHIDDSHINNLFANKIEIIETKINKLTINRNTDSLSVINSEIYEQQNLLIFARNIEFIDSSLGFKLEGASNTRSNSNFYIKNSIIAENQITGLNCTSLRIETGEDMNSIILHNIVSDHLNVNLANCELYLENVSARHAKFEGTNTSPHPSNITINSSNILKELTFKNLICNNLSLTGGELKNIPANVKISSSKLSLFKISRIQFNQSFKIVDSIIGDLKCTSVRFDDLTFFSNTLFQYIPRFMDTSFYPDISFLGCKFQTVRPADVGSLRNLKLQMKNIENERDEIFFASLELEAANMALIWKKQFLQKLFGWIYKRANNYGRSLSRPLLWILGSIILGGIINYYIGITLEIPTNGEPLPTYLTDVDNLPEVGKAVLSSIHNSLGPLTFISKFNIFTPNSLWLSCFHFFQNLFTSIFWYLFIVGIRRYFRTL